MVRPFKVLWYDLEDIEIENEDLNEFKITITDNIWIEIKRDAKGWLTHSLMMKTYDGQLKDDVFVSEMSFEKLFSFKYNNDTYFVRKFRFDDCELFKIENFDTAIYIILTPRKEIYVIEPDGKSIPELSINCNKWSVAFKLDIGSTVLEFESDYFSENFSKEDN